MEVKYNFNKQYFKGIKVSTSKVEDVAKHLKKTGFVNLGYKRIYVNNNPDSKLSALRDVRNRAKFRDREFGTIIFPWSKEAYIISTPAYEQFMLPVVQEIVPKAQINLAM